MSDKALRNDPWLEEFSYPSGNKFPATMGNPKDLPPNLDWQTDWQQIEKYLSLTPFLYTDIFEKYCRNPFSKDNYTNFVDQLQVPRVLNESKDDEVLVKPPFLVSYVSMAVHAGLGEQQCDTAEMVNK